MRGHWIRNLLLLIGAVVIAGAFWWAFRERPIPVDTAVLITGAMSVSIEEDGETRVREVYRISSPMSGNVDRSLLNVGDPVKAGETIVATINPLESPFMDERSLAEARALAEAARAAIGVAEAELQRAGSALALAKSDLDRAERLAKTNTIAESRLEQARIDVDLNTALVASARAQVALRESEFARARAALIQPGGKALREPDDRCCVRLTAPIDGFVLSLDVESEQVVTAGMPLAEIGDPGDIEIVADLLSSDATRVVAGSPAILSGWGGEPLQAKVRRIDPAGFTKVSALGIEEQRVNAILDLEKPEPGLGHGFQVRVALEVWSDDDVLMIPVAALFRDGSDWATFVIVDGRAEQRILEIGRMNGEVAQILGGGSDGDTVIIYPSDTLSDGIMVEPRG